MWFLPTGSGVRISLGVRERKMVHMCARRKDIQNRGLGESTKWGFLEPRWLSKAQQGELYAMEEQESRSC